MIMRTTRICAGCFLIISLLFLLSSFSESAVLKESDMFWSVELNQVSIYMNKKNAEIAKIDDRLTGKPVSKDAGGFYLIDGKNRMELYAKNAEFERQKDNILRAKIDYGDPSLQVVVKIECRDSIVMQTVQIKNLSEEKRFLEVRFSLPIDFSSYGWEYWDGFDGFNPDQNVYGISNTSNIYAINASPVIWKMDKKEHEKKLRADNLILGNVFMFPINCVFNNNYGFAIGLDPDYVQSYYSGGVQPVLSSYESFYYSLKFVIDGNSSVEQAFVLYDFDPSYSYRAALDTYYKTFPSIFEKRSGIDPRFNLAGTQTNIVQHLEISEKQYQDYWLGFCLRYKIGWTWFYAPFQKTGIFWLSKENYDPQAWKNKRLRMLTDYEKYQELATSANSDIGKGSALSYYIIPQRCDSNVADERFHDSKVITPEGESLSKNSGTLGEPVTTMFALGNSFGRHLEADIDEIMRSQSVDAIAFDNAFAHDPTVNFTSSYSGRAFTNEKEIMRNYIAYHQLMSKVRSSAFRTVSGFKYAVVANNPWNYATAALTDVGHIEWHPWKPQSLFNSFGATRYLLGPHKKITYKFHGNRQAPKSKNEREYFLNQRLYGLLQCLRYGAMPRVREALGMPDVVSVLPLLKKISDAGWNPVSGVRADQEDLWIERFGEGLNGYIVLINPDNAPRFLKGKLDEKYYGKGVIVFQKVSGDGLYKGYSRQGVSSFEAELKPVWYQVLKARALIDDESVDGELAFRENLSENGGILDISFRSVSKSKIRIQISMPELIRSIIVKINGKSVPFSYNNDIIIIDSFLKDKNTIQITWQNIIQWDSDLQEVVSFLNDASKGLSIVPSSSAMNLDGIKKIKNYLVYRSQSSHFDRWYVTSGRSQEPKSISKAGVEITADIPKDYSGKTIQLKIDPTLPGDSAYIKLLKDPPAKKILIRASNQKTLDSAIASVISMLNENPLSFGYDHLTDSFQNSAELYTLEKRYSWKEFLDKDADR